MHFLNSCDDSFTGDYIDDPEGQPPAKVKIQVQDTPEEKSKSHCGGLLDYLGEV